MVRPLWTAATREAAWADWKMSLIKSDRRLLLIAEKASKYLTPEQIRERILLDSPESWVAVTDILYPARSSIPKAAVPGWRPLSRNGDSGPSHRKPNDWLAWATTEEQAPATFPPPWIVPPRRGTVPQVELHRFQLDRFAQYLETEEIYDRAMAGLVKHSWNQARHLSTADRLDARPPRPTIAARSAKAH